MTTFKQNYNQELRPRLMKELNLTNIFAVPKVTKIVVNVGAGEAATNKKVLDKIAEELSIITGQKPIITKARKSISAFKIRKGMPIGVKVTLRGERMHSFLEKLIKIVLPRIRDFRGLSPHMLDGQGNLSIGLAEQTLFPEVDYDKIDRVRGLEITIVTTALNNEKARKLLEILGFPFREDVEHGKKVRRN